MRRKGCTSPSGHNDTSHQSAHLPRHAQPYQVRHINLRAEWPQLYGPHEGENQPHEKTDKRYNRQRLGPTLLHEERQIDTAKPGPAPDELDKCQGYLTEEGEERV